jgi:hypothetical protein
VRLLLLLLLLHQLLLLHVLTCCQQLHTSGDDQSCRTGSCLACVRSRVERGVGSRSETVTVALRIKMTLLVVPMQTGKLTQLACSSPAHRYSVAVFCAGLRNDDKVATH